MPPENRADDAYDAFKVHWNAELKLRDTSDGEKKPSLVRALRKAFGTYYFLGGLCKCGWSAFVITGAFFFVRRCVQAALSGLRSLPLSVPVHLPCHGKQQLTMCAQRNQTARTSHLVPPTVPLQPTCDLLRHCGAPDPALSSPPAPAPPAVCWRTSTAWPPPRTAAPTASTPPPPPAGA